MYCQAIRAAGLTVTGLCRGGWYTAEGALTQPVHVLIAGGTYPLTAPVVFEPNPTYQNIFGRIEKRFFHLATLAAVPLRRTAARSYWCSGCR